MSIQVVATILAVVAAIVVALIVLINRPKIRQSADPQKGVVSL